MINMKVDNYIIKSDDNNISVFKQQLNEQGVAKLDKNGEKELVVLVGYYRDLRGALKGIKRNYILGKGTNIQTIQDYEREVNAITDKFENQLKLQVAKGW